MQELGIKLWRNDGVEDWSIEINGLRHEHVCAQEMEELVEAAMIVAERSSLAEQHGGALYRTEIISELNSSPTTWVEVTRPRSALEHQLDQWIKQVAQANDELANALIRLNHSFELLLSGQKIPEANAVLAQAERALKAAEKAKNVA
jgi:hypothetical protein